MIVEWLGPLPESNYSETRFGSPVTLIVDHWTTSTFDGALAHFRNPAAKVSAHYIVGRDGRVGQIVSVADTAYHCGNFDKNTLSIGIEHEAGPTMPPTEELYAASAWLHARLAESFGIQLEVGVTVVPHRSIVPTQCPGTIDLDRIVKEAQGDGMDASTKTYIDAKFLELYGAIRSSQRRQMRGLDPWTDTPGDADDRPIGVMEQINPSNGRG